VIDMNFLIITSNIYNNLKISIIIYEFFWTLWWIYSKNTNLDFYLNIR
jgi:hypothetical protein